MSMSVAELNRLAADTGCSEHDDCLTCPLPDCIYDTSNKRASARRRNEAIREMAKAMKRKDIAKQLGVSVSTVKTALKEH